MPDQPTARAVQPRHDLTAGDTTALVGLGRINPPDPPRERPAPGPPLPDIPPAVETAHRAMLDDALAEAGVTQTPGDTAAVAAAARLDSTSVATIARWIRRGKPTGPSA